MMSNRIPWVLCFVLVVALGVFAVVAVNERLSSRWRRVEGVTAVERGRALASRLGCFGCHGADGALPIPNPGARDGRVPGWSAASWSASEVEAWIRDGHPADRQPDPRALIAMPAYDEWLDDAQMDDLVTYVQAVSRSGVPDDAAAARGYDVASRFGCFGCHGPEGRGGLRNPGSFTGSIPGWDGADYAEIVRDDDEFRQWVRNGISDRFESNPAARRFLDSQAIAMPAYGPTISEDELGDLLAYVAWLRRTP